MLQAPVELVRREYDYRSAFETSSPLSSPCSLYAVDSSPPSSPVNDPFLLNDSDDEPDIMTYGSADGDYTSPDPSPPTPGPVNVKGKGKDKLLPDLDASPAHPFSASTRAIKRPPSYSKDATRPKSKRQRNESEERWDVFGMPDRVGLHERDGYIQSLVPNITIPSALLHETTGEKMVDSLASPSQDPEHSLWEVTIAQAVDAAECKIDLSGHGLTHIPPKIADLSKLVVIREAAVPARELVPRRTCSKSTNSIVFGTGKLGHREDEIHLFLGRNNITSLPNELFNLDALVVLSLRANSLTELPPLICQLRNLRELNVANNKLRYLPSEILSLNLRSLAVDPNPFEENPFVKSEPSKKRWFGPIERTHTVVPLIELALRALLAPSSELYGQREPLSTLSGAKRQETVLEHCYDLPLQSEYVKSPLLREILSSCIPGSIATSQSPHALPSSSPEARRTISASHQRPCVSVCPSPRHLDVVGGRYRRPAFVNHSEERLSWEKRIAGQPVGGETGIPVRWRGCSAGCLEYLDQTRVQDPVAGDGAEEDWSVAMDVDNNRVDALPTCTTEQAPARTGFQAFYSADIDLDD
ncbi:hypothetical protein ACEPAI_3744 [Sanghuangporus weigelae]